VFSADNPVSIEDLVDKVLIYIKSVESSLLLYPPSNIINSEKKEILRNLHESGISEEIIAEHLDLNVGTVRMLIGEM
jgi:DNA-binding NarL/FixJ family response regulator